MRAVLALGSVLLAVPTQVPARAPTTLSPAGIAVQTSTGVRLADPAGHVEKTLAGYRLRVQDVERPGQVELRDRSGHDWEITAEGRLRPVATNSITLPDDWTLTLSSGWVLHRKDFTVRYPPGTELQLDGSGTVLNVEFPGRGPTYVRDLATGKLTTLPHGCRVGARVGKTDYELCGATIYRVGAGGRRTLTGAAQSRGSWQRLLPGPFGQPLLAQWSSPCGAQTAYFVDRTKGRRMELVDKGDRRADSRILGWLGTTPFAWLPHATCGPSAAPPGVYTYDANGRPLLVYRLSDSSRALVRFWGR